MGWARAWSRAPGTTSAGPWSPPIASTAIRTPRAARTRRHLTDGRVVRRLRPRSAGVFLRGLDLEDRPAAVVAAVRAGAMGRFGWWQCGHSSSCGARARGGRVDRPVERGRPCAWARPWDRGAPFESRARARAVVESGLELRRGTPSADRGAESTRSLSVAVDPEGPQRRQPRVDVVLGMVGVARPEALAAVEQRPGHAAPQSGAIGSAREIASRDQWREVQLVVVGQAGDVRLRRSVDRHAGREVDARQRLLAIGNVEGHLDVAGGSGCTRRRSRSRSARDEDAPVRPGDATRPSIGSTRRRSSGSGIVTPWTSNGAGPGGLGEEPREGVGQRCGAVIAGRRAARPRPRP